MKPYLTCAKAAQAEYVEKKSRFIGMVFPVQTEDEARAMYGMEPRKKAARDASMQDVEEGERLKKESEEADANIEKVNTEIGDLISKHLLAHYHTCNYQSKCACTSCCLLPITH